MIKIIAYFFSVCILSSCSFYSFTGASISTGIERIKIEYFKNDAKNYKSNIDVIITNKLTDLILNQTNLEINKSPIKKIIIKIIINLNFLKLKINKMSSFKNT